jgi:hypothetical protein
MRTEEVVLAVVDFSMPTDFHQIGVGLVSVVCMSEEGKVQSLYSASHRSYMHRHVI